MIKSPTGGGEQRDSNIELLRIIAMFFIISHHLVWNSGLTSLYDYGHVTRNMEFFQLFGAWGKTGINIFVFISGYFLCTSSLTVKRFLKVFLEAKFYAVVCYIALLLAGYEVLSGKRLFMLAFELIRSVNISFTGTFLTLYLITPFLNKLIGALNQRQHASLIGVLLTIYTVSATVLSQPLTYSELGWYVTLYLIAAYLRHYPMPWMASRMITGCGLLVSLLLCCGTILVIDHTPLCHYMTPYFLTNNCQHIGSLSVAVFAFLWFKNLKLGYHPVINLIASTTFGVFLIHTASDAMRACLWKDVLGVTGWYEKGEGTVLLLSFGSVLLIFLVASLIDLVRQMAIERPFFNLMRKYV